MGVMDKFDAAFKRKREEVRQRFDALGQMAVQTAVEKGSYHDVTGNLRRSNTYLADDTMLIIANTADYATEVEARGEDVLTSAILKVRGELHK